MGIAWLFYSLSVTVLSAGVTVMPADATTRCIRLFRFYIAAFIGQLGWLAFFIATHHYASAVGPILVALVNVTFGERFRRLGQGKYSEKT